MNGLAAALEEAGLATNAAPPEEVTTLSNGTPFKVVTHYHPDTDALCCLWAAIRFVVMDEKYSICFLPAGESLPAEEAEGFIVLEMDTGKGELDQHEKNLKRSSSFELFCKKFFIADDPGITAILEMTRKADNVEAMSPTDLHFVLRGLAYHYTDPTSKEVDWQAVCDYAFIALDVLYSQGRQRAQSANELTKVMRWYELPNGLVLATVWWKPALRDAAFAAGADIVMFTQNVNRKADEFYVGIQANRKIDLSLESVISGLRIAEAKKRGVSTEGHNLRAVGMNPAFGAWFLHDSLKLVACGTRSHPLSGDEFTRLTAHGILDVLKERLGQVRFKRK